MSHSVFNLLPWLEPLQVPLCFGVAWLVVIYAGITLGQFSRDVWQRARQMHQVPCHNCQFFTNDHRLKCPLHPIIANSETAINCRDYASSRVN